MAANTHNTPEERAAKRVEEFHGLVWHVAVYTIVNLFLWVVVPQAAFWSTLGWGIGLAFHIAFYFIGEDGRDGKRYQKYLQEERAREQENAF